MFAIVNAKELKKAIAAVARAAAKPNSREVARCPALATIRFSFTGDKLELAACDGFRLATLTIDCQSDTDAVCLVNAGTVKKWKSKSALATITIDGDALTLDQLKLSIDPSEYVDLDSLDIDHNITITVSAADLKQSIKAVKVFAKDNSNFVRFITTDAAMLIHSASAEWGDYTGLIPCQSNAEIEFAANCTYLWDALVNAKGDITINMTERWLPFEIHSTARWTIMPMSIDESDFQHRREYMHRKQEAAA